MIPEICIGRIQYEVSAFKKHSYTHKPQDIAFVQTCQPGEDSNTDQNQCCDDYSSTDPPFREAFLRLFFTEGETGIYAHAAQQFVYSGSITEYMRIFQDNFQRVRFRSLVLINYPSFSAGRFPDMRVFCGEYIVQLAVYVHFSTNMVQKQGDFTVGFYQHQGRFV